MKNLIITFLFSISFCVSIFAQYGSEGSTDARSMSLGKTSNAISQGIYSIGINPANLLNTNYAVDFSTVLPLPHIAASAGTNFMTVNNIDYYSGRYLTENDKQNLNSLLNGGGIIFGNMSFTLFSFGLRLDPSIGAFAFSINDFVEGDFTLPQSLSNLILNGNAQNSTYSFNDTKFNSWWIRNYSLSYAREIPGLVNGIIQKLSAGVTFKYYQGFAYAQSVQVNNNYLQTGTNNQITVSSNYVIHSAFSDDFNVKYSFDTASTNGKSNPGPFLTPAGTGLGLDFGFSSNLIDNWNISLAVTDIGNITWNQNTAITSAAGQYTLSDAFDQSQRDSIKNKFKGTSVNGGSFTTDLPTTLRLGAAHKFYFNQGSFPGTLLLAMDINQGFNDEPGNSTKTRFSIGGEWQLAHGVPYIRTGFSFGGLLGFHWAAGLGIDTGTLEFNFATMDFQSFAAPNSAKYLSVALDSRWKF
ncbi:MAG: DUF5723 family protein [Ignavibacteriaceae bacterium]